MSLLNSSLVGENNYLIALRGKLFNLRKNFIIQEEPIVCVLGKFSPALAGDNRIIHVKRSDFDTSLQATGAADQAGTLLTPGPLIRGILILGYYCCFRRHSNYYKILLFLVNLGPILMKLIGGWQIFNKDNLFKT